MYPLEFESKSESELELKNMTDVHKPLSMSYGFILKIHGPMDTIGVVLDVGLVDGLLGSRITNHSGPEPQFLSAMVGASLECIETPLESKLLRWGRWCYWAKISQKKAWYYTVSQEKESESPKVASEIQ